MEFWIENWIEPPGKELVGWIQEYRNLGESMQSNILYHIHMEMCILFWILNVI